MTISAIIQSRFAWIAQHGGPVVDWAASDRHRVSGTGLSGWNATGRNDRGKPLSIGKRITDAMGTRMLEIGVAPHADAEEMPLRWDSTLKVSDGRYVRSGGLASDFPSALIQVQAHMHESRKIGGLTWWRESEDRWISWLGAFDLCATKVAVPDRVAHWTFQVSGRGVTLEEAALQASLGRIVAADSLED